MMLSRDKERDMDARPNDPTIDPETGEPYEHSTIPEED